MTLPAGSLRHRVTIEQTVQSQDATTGDVTTVWSVLDEVWASIQPLSAREFVAAQAVQSVVDTRIVIRWRDDVRASMRVRRGDDLYDIHGALPDMDSGREYLTLVCSKREAPAQTEPALDGGNAAGTGIGWINGGTA